MKRTRRAVLSAALTAALAAPLAGCGSGSGAAGSSSITVLAAASLTDAFRAEIAAFERADPGTHVTASYGGSQQLVAQVEQGAPADVVATADEQQMQRLTDAHRLAGRPVDFTTNVLEIAVGRGNPQHVTGLADLARPGLVVVLAAPQVPAGDYARVALGKAGVEVHPASLEADVRSVLTKVALGEADAGVVYASDVTSAATEGVVGVPIPPADNVVAHYPIAAVAGGATGPAGRFIAFVRSPQGQHILAAWGFGKGG